MSEGPPPPRPPPPTEEEEEEEVPSRGVPKKRELREESGRATKIPKKHKVDGAWPSSLPRRAKAFEHGWFLETHERVFEALLRHRKPKVVLELGSWYGSSTRWLAERCPEATLYAIDLWDDDFILAEQVDHYGTMGEGKLRRMLREHPLWESFVANLWDLRDRVVPLRTSTARGVETIAEAGVEPDIVYVDADHHYDAVKADIEACLTRFPDAVLVGDDYGHYDSVRRAVTECAQKFNKVVHVDQNHCWAFAKIDSLTGRNFFPKPKKGAAFSALLADFKKAPTKTSNKK